MTEEQSLLTKEDFLDILTKDREKTLHLAAVAGFTDLIKILLRSGTDVNALNSSNGTALHMAVSCGYKDIVQVLLDHGARLDVRDVNGYTPLCVAVWQKSADLAQMLFDAGAKVSENHCPLHHAVIHKRIRLAKLLLDNNCNPNLRNKHSDTPLLLAARTHDIVMAKLLLEHGALPDYSNNVTGVTPLHQLVSSDCSKEDYSTTLEAFIRLLIEYDVDLDLCCPGTGTALTKALLMGKYKTAQLLIQVGADVNKVPEKVGNPYNNLTIVLRNMQLPLIKLLIAAGYNLGARGCPDLQFPQNKNDLEADSPKAYLLRTKFRPRCLAEICRLRLRKHFGMKVSIVVPMLCIPNTLKRYVLSLVFPPIFSYPPVRQQSVETKVKEHIQHMKKNNGIVKSTVAEHCHKMRHSILFDETRVITRYMYYFPRIAREAVEIYKHNNLNKDLNYGT